jgi:hypothetical protein
LANVEFGIAQIKARTGNFIEGRLALLPRRFRPYHFLWACALMPVFVLPPAVSLSIALMSMRKTARDTAPVNFEWIAIVSALNLILTGLILYKFHFSPGEVIAYGGDVLRAMAHSLYQWLSVPRQPARLIPA